MAGTTLRRFLRFSGALVSAAALVWIAVRFERSGALEVLARAPASPLALAIAILIGACGYAIAMCLPALAWWRLVSALSPGSPPPALATMATYAASQYGKYLPGNVAHYALRHAWSRRYGLPHAGLGLASILEAILLVLAALCLTLLADTQRLRLLSALDPRLAILLLLLVLAALAGVLHWLRRHPMLGRHHVPMLPSSPVLVSCLALYLCFMLLSAALLDGLAHALGIGVESFAMLLAASAASWLAGFVVIGAPGGLGVREAAFVALAGTALGESQALLLIGLFRVVTFLGDTLFFAAGAIMLRSGVEQDPAESTPSQ